jgi:hypothetical protein
VYSSKVLAMMGNYEDRKVDRTELQNGVEVSTCYTTDYGFETALIGTSGQVFPVERYGWENREGAKVGHTKWVSFAENNFGKEFSYLGSNYDALEEDGTAVLS